MQIGLRYSEPLVRIRRLRLRVCRDDPALFVFLPTDAIVSDIIFLMQAVVSGTIELESQNGDQLSAPY